MRVAIYARVSSESQEARGTIGSQLDALRRKMTELGHNIVHEYTDDGYSGARLDRPGLDALRDAAEAGLFDQAWCLTPDRLARSYAYQILVTDELTRHGVQICYLDAPPLADDPEATLLVQVQGVIAEYERAKIAERNRRGRLFRARAGEIVYRLVPYGYRRIPRGPAGPSHLEVCEPEAVVVRRIFDDFVAGGCSMRRICRGLYEDGILSPTGKATWSIACLSQMLRNSTYKGRAIYNRHQAMPPATGCKSTRNKLRPPEEWIEIPVPGIVSEEVFDAAQRISRDHTFFSPRHSAPGLWLLRRLVVCGHCGVKTYCQYSKGRSGRTLRYYVCNRRRPLEAGGPDRACPQPSTRAEALEALVWDQLRQALLHPETLRHGQAVLGRRSEHPDGELLTAQLNRLDRRLQQTEAEQRRVVDLYQMQAIERREFQMRHREVIERHRQLQQEREALVKEHKELGMKRRLAQRIDAFADRVRQGIDVLDFEQRQRLVRLVVEQVRVTGPNVEIHVRIPLDDSRPPEDINGPRRRENIVERIVSSQDRLRSLGGAILQHRAPAVPAAWRLPLRGRAARRAPRLHRLLEHPPRAPLPLVFHRLSAPSGGAARASCIGVPMTAAKRPVRSRSVLADDATELTTTIRADGRHDHVTVRADRSFLYVDVEEEPVVRLEFLTGNTYGLWFHHHSGRWEPTPFTGDLVRLARVLTTEFGAYLDAYDFPPAKSGPDH